MSTDLTLVVPTYNRREELRRCLTSFRTHASSCPVLIVDDGSTDGTWSMITHEFPQVQSLRLPGNHGPAYARNRGAEKVCTPYMAFFDSDIELTPGWLEGARSSLAPHLILAGRVNRPDGSLEWGPRRTRSWGGSTPCRPDAATVASSNNLVAPVEWVRRVPFREELGIYFEDTFFCIEARSAGAEVAYREAMAVLHHHHSAHLPDRVFRQARNRAWMMVQHQSGSRRQELLQLLVGFGHACGHLLRGRVPCAVAALKGVVAGLAEVRR